MGGCYRLFARLTYKSFCRVTEQRCNVSCKRKVKTNLKWKCVLSIVAQAKTKACHMQLTFKWFYHHTHIYIWWAYLHFNYCVQQIWLRVSQANGNRFDNQSINQKTLNTFALHSICQSVTGGRWAVGGGRWASSLRCGLQLCSRGTQAQTRLRGVSSKQQNGSSTRRKSISS